MTETTIQMEKPLARDVTLGRRAYFSAARTLERADWSPAKNQEAFGKRAHIHGHDYVLDVYYRGEPAGIDGMVVNISDLKPLINDILRPLDGGTINDIEYFHDRLPILENLVKFLWSQFPRTVAGGTLEKVRLQESETYWVELTANSMRITNKYDFAAAHRLHAPELSEEENDRRYGKCNNPRGHGHNYQVEVTLEGESSDDGELLSPGLFDKIVEEEVFDRFDHKHLNEDCPEFTNLIPTSENLARVIFQKIQGRIDGLHRANLRLAKIGLHETQKNYFEVVA
jgi:6-pyruvoyltetrahydropterin/6-carboxytetrahydropterin synthase